MKHTEEQREYWREYKRKWRKNNPDKEKEINARANAKNADYHKKFNHIYHLNNRENILERHRKYRENNREHINEYSRQYRKSNPEITRDANLRWHRDEANQGKIREYSRERRSRKRNAPGRGITSEQEQQIYEEYNYLCAYCGQHKPLTIDHIEPLIRGGAHDIENATAACLSCNSEKGDKTLLRFLYDRLQKG